MKPMSGASPRIRVAWLREGEGEARRNAGLMECSEALLLFLLSGWQGLGTDWWDWCPEQPAAGGPVEGAGALGTSWPRGVVLVVPRGHRPWRLEERTTLSSRSLVLCVHCVKRMTYTSHGEGKGRLHDHNRGKKMEIMLRNAQ